MIIFALGFVFGAWLLQQQAVLPSQPLILLLIVGLTVSGYLALSRFKLTKFTLFAKSDLLAKPILLVRAIAIFSFACLFGFIWAAAFATIRLNDVLPKEWEQQNVEIIGVIASLPEVTERGERFRFDVEKVITPQAKIPQHISLHFYREIDRYNAESTPQTSLLNGVNYFYAGERWQFTVRLKRPHTTYNPHGFDFEAWALAENIRATGSIRNKSGYNKLADFVWRPHYLIERWRETVGNHITKVLENKQYAGVIRALVIGDDSQISQANWNVYLRTGVNHLMSISGLHITMLSGLAFALVAFCWRRIPALVMHMPTRKAATIAGVLIAFLYACLAGWSVPTQRTIYMLLIFALALLTGRSLAISRVLSIALVVVVILDPWAVIAPGFWLSFGAVAMIAYASVSRLRLVHWLKAAVITQWSVTLGLLPLLIFMFGQASIVSPLANAFAIPVIGLIVVPLAILGSLLSVDFILHTSLFVLDVCMQGLNWLSTLPIWQQAAPPMWTMILAVSGVLWLLLPRGFPQRWLGLTLLLPLFFASSLKLGEGEMQVTVLDVGQGLAVVIRTQQHTFLYDSGPRYSAQSDAGGRIIVPFLRREGVKKLSGMMVSHNDIDHSGGAASVLMQLPVAWLASSFDTADYPSPKHVKCYAGQHWQWDKVDFEVLHPSIESYQDPAIKDNNMSCVLKVTGQFGSILLAGDIEKAVEKTLINDTQQDDHAESSDATVNKGASLNSDILVAPHHGSKTSSSLDFIEAVNAKHTIFTVGYLNRFKHPKPLIINSYINNGATTYRSDYQGALRIDFKKNAAIKLNAWREIMPKYWHDVYGLNEN